jgi:glycosyltransferase involved in cell wall biosynthesis
MNIVHINNVDILGGRFNGHDMQIYLNKKGINAKQFVVEKLGRDPNTIDLTYAFEEPALRQKCMDFESNESVQSLIYPYGFRLMSHPAFKKADIAHYHLIHNYFMSLACLPDLFNAKPSVYTIHDPWIFSGHCVHPMDCKQWKTGCRHCPHLDLNIQMNTDRAAFMWKIKKEVFSKAPITLVVASKYMKEIALESPITQHMPIFHIPFGIDLSLFAHQKNAAGLRKSLGIPADSFVLFFRSDKSPFKGLHIIKDMLNIINQIKPVTLLTVGQEGLLYEYENTFKIIEKGWVTNDKVMANLYSVCDVFLMPSLAEAFGLMAIEAMATGRPVVVMENTSLPEVSFAPQCGISISRENPAYELKSVLERLMQNPDECRIRGEMGRELAKKHYSFDDYVKRHLELYDNVIYKCAPRKRVK